MSTPGQLVLDTAPSLPRLIGLGEPLHGSDAFGRSRNDVLRHLVEHAGFRTIALESSSWAGRLVDAWVRGGPGDLDDVLARGITHDFGRFAPNRELLEWARTHNAGRAPEGQVHVTGFDGPLEMMFAESPRATLAHLHAFLTDHGVPVAGWDTLDGLLGDDAPWIDPAAATDASRSVGSQDRVRELRTLADDLARTLTCTIPALVPVAGRDAVDDAALAARCATGLLAYHSAMAEPLADALRWSRLSGLRDAMMADNLQALSARRRTLASGHNLHLRTGSARMAMGPMDVGWQPAGAHLSDRLGADYLAVGTAVGRLDGVEDAGQDTIEAWLAAQEARVVPTGAIPRGRPRRATTSPAYFPLDDAVLDELDAVLFVPDAR
ncbi:erythromycin esterase family protein [Pseudonocardia endophytica]|uniref:Erythromycin esterase-like protein n=1 Tax=Pseudonocardia endophytica TaxID=401976 RepID=A0A4R1HTE7_PSEEN|nr:erythromycin esterase family protein [Pseudonocardia endophytica]TCK25954.1 erythromycin esterase-like protein [Pseudonocardia endophytica]